MAVKQPLPTIQFPVTAQTTQVTLSPLEIRHYISDDELRGLSDMQQDPAKDICLAAIGGFIGAATPAFDGLSRFGNALHPMTKTDLVSMFVASATLAVAAVTSVLWRQKLIAKTRAVDTIRNRPKAELVRT